MIVRINTGDWTKFERRSETRAPCTEWTTAALEEQYRINGVGQEISVFLQDRADTKDISLKENALRGAGIGSMAGALVSLLVPGIGPILATGPLLGLLNGAAAGGAIGGLLGGSGALKPLGLPDELAERIKHRLGEGEILISVHTHDSQRLNRALEIFKSEGSTAAFDGRKQPAA